MSLNPHIQNSQEVIILPDNYDVFLLFFLNI